MFLSTVVRISVALLGVASLFGRPCAGALRTAFASTCAFAAMPWALCPACFVWLHGTAFAQPVTVTLQVPDGGGGRLQGGLDYDLFGHVSSMRTLQGPLGPCNAFSNLLAMLAGILPLLF